MFIDRLDAFSLSRSRCDARGRQPFRRTIVAWCLFSPYPASLSSPSPPPSISTSSPRHLTPAAVFTEIELKGRQEYILIPCTFNPGECAKYTVAFTLTVRPCDCLGCVLCCMLCVVCCVFYVVS